MLRLTTSMPTPRPDRSVTLSAVEKPGAKISCQTSLSLGVAPSGSRPRSMALARMRSRRRPRPSSLTSITMLPPSWQALICSRPVVPLPAAMRSAGNSMPWSRLLRTRCISGSAISSTMLLSSSVSPPVTTNSISLPSCLLVSRTTRWKRLKVSPTGTMRSASAPSRVACTSSLTRWLASRNRAEPSWLATICAPLPAITSSPIRSIRWSSLSARTLTKRASAGARRSRPVRRSAGAGAATTGAVAVAAAAAAAAASASAGVSGANSPALSWLSTPMPTPMRAHMANRAKQASPSPWQRRSSNSSSASPWASGGRITMLQSSTANSNTRSISSWPASVCSRISKPRWQVSASRLSSPGTAASSNSQPVSWPMPAR